MNPELKQADFIKANTEQSNDLVDIYSNLNQDRLEIDELGCDYCRELDSELAKQSLNLDRIGHIIGIIEALESIAANAERAMQQNEQQLGRDINESLLYNDMLDDFLVQSAILYPYRLNHLKDVTQNQNINQLFVEAVINYLHSIDAMITCRDQDDREMLNLNRIRSHNNMIHQLNQLNSLCRQNQIEPFTYRDFVTSSPANHYQLNLQQAHDRATVASYVSQILANHTSLDTGDQLADIKADDQRRRKALYLLSR